MENSLSNNTSSLPQKIIDFETENVTLVYVRLDGMFYKIEQTANLAFYEVITNAYELSL